MKRKLTNAERAAQAPKFGWSVDELAASYGVTRQKIYDEINADRLESMLIGKRRVVPDAARQKWEAKLLKRAENITQIETP
jgi:predicted DNA-binding protein YlxM (UPF0122 family)